MTTLKINRFDLTEIERVTIRCKRCGAGAIINLDNSHFVGGLCPSCCAPFGELSAKAFEFFQKACHTARREDALFRMEFDVTE